MGAGRRCCPAASGWREPDPVRRAAQVLYRIHDGLGKVEVKPSHRMLFIHGIHIFLECGQMMAENEPRTIGYLRVSRESQDPEKNRADILTLANREDPKERNPETQGMKSYGGIGTYVRLGPLSGVRLDPIVALQGE